MRQPPRSTKRSQQGFTLVEIGVVLVIIGLLLGAVLKGQELIGSARVFNVAQTMNGYRAAIYAFQDRYREIPGDSSRAATRVGGGAVNCTIGCDDRIINFLANVSLINNHLVSAGLIQAPQLSVETDTWPTANGYLTNPANAPIFAASINGFSNPGGAYGTTVQHMITTGWNLSSRMLGELDRKIDDGNGWTGQLRYGALGGPADSCINPANGVWIEINPFANCAAWMVL